MLTCAECVHIILYKYIRRGIRLLLSNENTGLYFIAMYRPGRNNEGVQL